VSDTRIVHRRRRPHQAFHTHPGFREPKVQRLVRSLRQRTIHRNQIARPRRLARDDDLVLAQARFERELGALYCRQHHALVDDLFRRPPEISIRVLLHLRDHELLVERPGVDTNPNRFSAITRDAADRRELLVPSSSGADITGVDAVLVERFGAVRVARQEQMPVVVKIADKRGGAARVEHTPLDFGHGLRGFGDIDRDTDELGTRFGELNTLLSGRGGVDGIGAGHRLDDDGSAAPNLDRADPDTDRSMKSHD
jgi:hypothetical protein